MRLAQYGYDGNVIQASRAIQTIESFVLAELLSTSPSHADIVFREPTPRGKYNLVCVTRCGESLDYKPRRIGHPVRVE